MADYKQVYVTPWLHQELTTIAKRDHLTPWLIIQDALEYYKRVHPEARTPPPPDGEQQQQHPLEDGRYPSRRRPRGRPPHCEQPLLTPEE
jgi:hypothetical protein